MKEDIKIIKDEIVDFFKEKIDYYKDKRRFNVKKEPYFRNVWIKYFKFIFRAVLRLLFLYLLVVYLINHFKVLDYEVVNSFLNDYTMLAYNLFFHCLILTSFLFFMKYFSDTKKGMKDKVDSFYLLNSKKVDIHILYKDNTEEVIHNISIAFVDDFIKDRIKNHNNVFSSNFNVSDDVDKITFKYKEIKEFQIVKHEDFIQ